MQISDLSKAPLLSTFLAPYKQQIRAQGEALSATGAAAPALPLSALLRSLAHSAETTSALQLLRFVAALLAPPALLSHAPAALGALPPHRALIAFWTSTLVQFCVLVTGQPLSGSSSGSGAPALPGGGGGKLKPQDAQAYLGILLPAATSAASYSGAQSADQRSGTAPSARREWREAKLAGSMLLCAVAGCFELSNAAVAAILHEFLPAQVDEDQHQPRQQAGGDDAMDVDADAAGAGAGAGASASHSKSKSKDRKDKRASREELLQTRAVLAACYALCIGPARDASQSPASRQAVASELFDDATLGPLLALPHLEKVVEEDSQLSDTTAFLELLLTALIAKVERTSSEQRVAQALTNLLASKSLPSSVRESALQQLVAVPFPEEGSKSELHDLRVKLLATARQRFPRAFDKALEQHGSSAAAAAGSKKKSGKKNTPPDAASAAHKAKLLQAVIAQSTLSQLQISLGQDLILTDDSAGASAEDHMWLALLSSQATEREVALRSILGSFKLAGASDEQKRQMKATLLSRMRDESAKVLAALYQRADLLLSIAPSEELLATLESVFADRAVLAAEAVSQHVLFLFNHLLAKADLPSAAARSFRKIIFPSLLQQQGDSASAISPAVQALAKAASAPGQDVWASLLRALRAAASQAQKAKSSAEALELLVAAAAEDLSGAEAGARTPAVSFLVKEAQRHSAPATLILADLIGRSSPESSGLGADFWSDAVALCRSGLDERAVHFADAADAKQKALASATEPASSSNASSATAWTLLYALLQSLGNAAAASSEELFHIGSVSQSAKTADECYRCIVGARLSDSSNDNLIVAWTMALGRSSLLRLASTLAGRESSTAVRLTAAKHLASLIQSRSSQGRVDYQTILPALIVATCDAEEHIRAAAVGCMQAILQAPVNGSANAAVEVYAVETVYGAASSQLQYLQPQDALKLLTKLAEEGERLAQDQLYARQFLTSSLATVKGEPRKEAAWKHASLCYLLSHVVSWPAVQAKVALLELLIDIRSPAKLQTLLPGLKECLEKYEQGAARDYDERSLVLHFKAYDRSVRSMLETGSEAWKLLLQGLSSEQGEPARYRSQTDEALTGFIPAAVVRKAAAQATSAVYTSLSEELRQELLKAMAADSSQLAETEVGPLASCLFKLPIETSTMQGALAHFRQKFFSSAESAPSAKKARRSEVAPPDARTAGRAYALLLAVLHARRIGLSTALASDLVEDIRLIAEHRQTSAFDSERSITQVLSTLDAAAADPQRKAETLSGIRVDVLVGLLKIPFSRTLLHKVLTLLAKVADVAADQVVHNIMPIFTFVGVSVMSRDDDASFAIVEHSIRDIVPALSNAYRKQVKSSDHFALSLHCRDFLRIFTNAVRYMPRHRRAATFCLLVDTLGAQDFLGAVCLLLIDRHSSKIVKSGPEQARATLLELPLSILEEYPAAQRAAALEHCLQEASRLVAIGQADPLTVADQVFLDRLAESDSEHAPHLQDGPRQASAVLTFVAAAVSEAHLEQASVRKIAEQAQAIASAGEGSVRVAASRLVDAATAALQSEGFAEFVLSLLADEEVSSSSDGTCANPILTLFLFLQRIDDALRLLVTRSCVAPAASDRKTFGRHIGTLVPKLWSAAQAQSDTRRQLAVRALLYLEQQIATTETAEWASLLPSLLDRLEKDATGIGATLQLMTPIVSAIGPRVIPSVSRIVTGTARVLQGAHAQEVATECFGLLTALVKASPTFAVAHLSSLVDLLLQGEVNKHGKASATLSLTNAIIRSYEHDQVITALSTQWSKCVERGPAWASSLIVLLRRLLAKADKATMTRLHKSAFRFLLQIFDYRAASKASAASDAIDAVEDEAIRAFLSLTMRLNETTFRPLFLRFYDWAAVDLVEEGNPWESEAARSRTLTFFRFVCTMQDQLKALVTNYTTTTLDYTLEGLAARANGTYDDDRLWSVLQLNLVNSATNDDGSFWNTTRAKRTIATLSDGLSLAAESSAERVAPSTGNAITAIARAVSDPALLKSVNRSLLAKTRATSSQEVTAALIVLTQLWDAVGDDMLSLVAETAPFLSEVLGNADPEQVEHAQMLVSAVEAALGEPLDQYLT